jgi:preprotein translocase subunit SecD
MRTIAAKMIDRCKQAGLAGLLLVFGLLVSALPASAQPIKLEVATASLAFDLRTNEPVVSFRLTPDSAKVFSELTAKSVGRPMAIIIDGRVMLKPVIREPITGGTGQISSNLTAADAKALAERLASGKARLEIEVQD